MQRVNTTLVATGVAMIVVGLVLIKYDQSLRDYEQRLQSLISQATQQQLLLAKLLRPLQEYYEVSHPRKEQAL